MDERVTIFGVLVHPDEPAVLLVRDGDSWALPSVTIEANAGEGDAGAEDFARLFSETLQADIGVLRTAAQVGEAGVYELETTGGEPVGTWRPAADVADPELSRVADAAIRGRRDPHPLRPPWEYPGWLRTLGAWVDEQLAGIGATRTDVELVRSWSISAVARVETSAGRMYAKAVPPYFAAEPTITAALSSRFPGAVPSVVAADPARGLLLLRDVAGAEAGDPERGLALLATMQCASVDDTASLVRAGCAQRPLAAMSAELQELLDDPLTTELVPVDDMESLRGLKQSISDGCAELASCGVPDTLVHGDMHPGNVLAGPVIIDWTDAALSHPFFDLPTWFRFARATDVDPDERSRALDAYQGPWRNACPDADLGRAVELAERLGPLYHAVSYLRIVRATEPASRWQFERMVPGLVGRLTGSRYRGRA